jgi:hypothetical protein
MRNKEITFCLLIFAIGIYSYQVCIASDSSNISGNINVWWNVYEQNENGVQQSGTKDNAADVASGFNIKQARLTYDYNKSPFSARAQVRFEERVALLDCYISWQPCHLAQLYIGQMKVPSTYEALAPDKNLDFISRSSLSKVLTDWSLSRPPYFSPFYGNRSDYRDMGIGIKGNLGIKTIPDLASYFLMVSNGLGANLSIGSNESKEFILSNNFGDFFYGARLELSPISLIKLGGHYSLNKHNNILYNDGKTILDFKRHSWSVDMSLELLFLRFVAMYGEGEVDDDYFQANVTNSNYSGWETKLLAEIIKNKLQLGVRFDRYTDKYLNGFPIDQDNLTFGLNFLPTSNVRVQLNYIKKITDDVTQPDLNDDIVFFNFQCYFTTD